MANMPYGSAMAPSAAAKPGKNKPGQHANSAGSMHDDGEVYARVNNPFTFGNPLLIIVATLWPCIAVLFKRVCGKDFFINFLLGHLGFVPAPVHAWWAVWYYSSPDSFYIRNVGTVIVNNNNNNFQGN